ncbi:MAG: dihydroorotase [Proteobacteria bacterium]|nr:dihydroorotase [Pseudomonadota bacterium]MBU2227291.1 dihydroorotase [Pseudomonadota bacterium]
MTLLLKGGRVVDPSLNRDEVADLLIKNGKIVKLGKDLYKANKAAPDIEVLDLRGKIVVPGLIDIHTHLREPGFEYKETIASGSEAALAGGFTSIACMPNTNPVNDNRSVTEFIRRKTTECGLVNVYPIAAISVKSEGTFLTEFLDLKDAGAVGFSDDGKPVMNAALMRRALEYASSLDMPIIAHCEDKNLSAGGVMHEGFVAAELGLSAIPSVAEEIMVARDLLLAEFTSAPLHIAHVSTAGSVRMIREAKARGIRVTAETAPHYFTLTDEALRGFDTNLKVYPPLRSREDRASVREGLSDGTLDVIASDHAPHARTDKEVEFDYAASGLTGLETSLSLSLGLVADGALTLLSLIEKMTVNPAGVLRLPKGGLAIGADADVTVIDPDREWICDRALFRSRGRNSPFHGWTMKGKAILTIVGGTVRYRDF